MHNLNDILPTPFEWCDIPAGEVDILGRTFAVDPFTMAKYPITYDQFQVFVDAGLEGFYNAAWWEGLARREEKPGAPTWPVSAHPVENVSWYDAVAFCRWLSSLTGDAIRLPTEWEWQWAAQGGDKRLYPWGNTYSAGYANVNEKGVRISGDGAYLAQTTPVNYYPQGASPFGVMDMCGNLWEWCLNEISRPAALDMSSPNRRSLRGGSFFSGVYNARTTSRYGWSPLSRSQYLGFRIIGKLKEG